MRRYKTRNRMESIRAHAILIFNFLSSYLCSYSTVLQVVLQ